MRTARQYVEAHVLKPYRGSLGSISHCRKICHQRGSLRFPNGLRGDFAQLFTSSCTRYQCNLEALLESKITELPAIIICRWLPAPKVSKTTEGGKLLRRKKASTLDGSRMLYSFAILVTMECRKGTLLYAVAFFGVCFPMEGVGEVSFGAILCRAGRGGIRPLEH